MGNFAEVLAENQSKNMNRIRTYMGKQLNSLTGAATISVNPVRHTSRANASGKENRNSDSSQGETDMRNAKRKHLSSKCQKSNTYIRDTGEHCQPPEEDELPLYDGSDLDDQIDRLVDTPQHLPIQMGFALMKRVKIVMGITSSKILKMISIQWNKLSNP